MDEMDDDTYIVVTGDDHLCTLQKNCDEPECWEQTDGAIEGELVERLGSAISSYISQL